LAERTLIVDLKPNELVDDIFALQNCQLGMTRGGKPYLKCLLGDRSGRTPGRMWNATQELFDTLPTDGFVHLEGQTQPYQGEMQIVIQKICSVEPTDEELTGLLPTTKHDIDQMFSEVSQRLSTIKHPALAALAQQYLNDQDLMQKFRRAPAAMTIHHAFIGGLLEHTLNVLRLADVLCPLYPQLNREIILFGLFIHDLGKCVELTWEMGFSYSEDGQLVGHIARGVVWLQEKAKACASSGTIVPEPILRVLCHIILSHHGKVEFGALKVPATPEAIAVNLIDNVDAKLQIALEATGRQAGLDQQLGGHFTEKVWALDTRLYRPDPTKVSPEGA